MKYCIALSTSILNAYKTTYKKPQNNKWLLKRDVKSLLCRRNIFWNWTSLSRLCIWFFLETNSFEISLEIFKLICFSTMVRKVLLSSILWMFQMNRESEEFLNRLKSHEKLHLLLKFCQNRLEVYIAPKFGEIYFIYRKTQK